MHRPRPFSVLVAFFLATSSIAHAQASAPAPDAAALQDQRRRFQVQELITARPFSYIFNVGETPRIVWRDVAEVERLGGSAELRVRWFDAQLNEAPAPDHPGRWGAYVEGTAPNGTPVRRSITFFARPPGFLLYFPPDLPTPLPYQPGPIAEGVWHEHQAEIAEAFGSALLRALNDSEIGATLIAGLSEAQPLGRPAGVLDSAAVRNDDFHLALKLKVLGLSDKVRPLAPPRKRPGAPAPVLREGPPTEAGVREDAKERIDAVCRAWAEDSGEPFVTLVARHGVIVTHAAFGNDAAGQPIGLDYRADVASITKTVTAIVFSQFLDQGLIDLDARVSGVFPDYPDNEHVPTFRQCFTHTSGLSGHGEFGGSRNPHFENVILNGIDANQPGKAYVYTGMGFDLAAKAMEIVAGKSMIRLYHDHLFHPLEMGDVPMESASAGARFTARQLGVLAQWMANRGSYGELQFISEATFDRLLPEDLSRRYPQIDEIEGIGNHWMPAPALGPRTLGHGSLSSCMFLIDLDRDLVVVQVRRQAGARHGEWSARFLQEVVDSLLP